MARHVALALLAVSSVATSCGGADFRFGQQHAPIVNGQGETRLPAVGRLIIEAPPEDPAEESGARLCTGTLVAPRVVLTAAHCLVDMTSGTFEVGDGSEPEQPLYQPVIHPNYRRGDKGDNNSDIAVAYLNQPVRSAQPLPLLGGLLQQGTPILLMGYGRTGEDTDDAGYKRSASNTIDELTDTELLFQDSTGSVGGVCNGDSGGPSLIADGAGWRVAGVHSRGTCEWELLWIFDLSFSVDTRVDVFRAWIQQQMQNLPAPIGPTLYTSLADGAVVAPGATFELTTSGQSVAIYVDGNDFEMVEGDSLQRQFALPNELVGGVHTLRIVAFDDHRFSTSREFSITISGGSTIDGGPESEGESLPTTAPTGTTCGIGTPIACPPDDEAGGCAVSASSGPVRLPLAVLALLVGIVVRKCIKLASSESPAKPAYARGARRGVEIRRRSRLPGWRATSCSQPWSCG